MVSLNSRRDSNIEEQGWGGRSAWVRGWVSGRVGGWEGGRILGFGAGSHPARDVARHARRACSALNPTCHQLSRQHQIHALQTSHSDLSFTSTETPERWCHPPVPPKCQPTCQGGAHSAHLPAPMASQGIPAASLRGVHLGQSTGHTISGRRGLSTRPAPAVLSQPLSPAARLGQ